MAGIISILHVLPHCGGGVGTVIRALLEAEQKEDDPIVNIVASLDYLNDITKQKLDALNIPWMDCLAKKGGDKRISDLILKADIVLIHWWNHPFLMQLLFQGLPPSKVALWSHVNGLSYPQSFFKELFLFPDRFVFATKASWQSPIVQSLTPDMKHKLKTIRSCAGIPKNVEKKINKDLPFRFGYIGTVESIKMHKNFLKLCSAANIPSKCIVAGGPAHHELRSQAELLGISDKFDILGHVDDIENVFKRLHVLAYPLNPMNYGTGEQVLIESMAYGTVPVVFDNPPERELIRHGETGLIVRTEEEFTKAIRFLADNPDERMRLAIAGQQFVFNECDIKFSLREFHAVYDEMLSLSKTPHKLFLPNFHGVDEGSPFHLFLGSCGSGKIRNYFKKKKYESVISPIPSEFRSKTRGTPQHYYNLLGYDSNLELLCRECNSGK